MSNYIQHALILPDTVEQRLYQLDLAGKSLNKSALIVLPTGLGKTIISLLVIAARLEKYGGKAMLLSPTKPLVEQHSAFLKNVMNIPPETILTFTGSVNPDKRAQLWTKAKIIVSTPQVIENDLLTKRIDLKDVCHITFDEAHRAIGNYAYTYIAEKYFETASNPHCIGITASPGSNNEKVSEVCEALHIQSVSVKTETDRDVKPYIHKKDIEWIKVELPPEMVEIKTYFEKIITERFDKLKDLGFPVYNTKYVNKKDLLGMQTRLQAELKSIPDPRVYSAISILAEIMKVNHAIEILETQGMESLSKYMERLEHEAYSKGSSKASKRLMEDLYIRQALKCVKASDSEHPKLKLVQKVVTQQLNNNADSRIIVFTNYRDTADMVTTAFEQIENIKPAKFVGQSSKYKDKGLTQKQQVQIINEFKDGTYNVLVATSVAEEGLDIPATDLVVFYEPIPSEIRSIQRKGRTARKHEGKVLILVTKNTRDEGYYWSSLSKEKRMQTNMRELQETMPAICDDFSENQLNQKQLLDFENKVRIVVDHREIRSHVVHILEKLGAAIEVKTLEVGDYIVSSRLAIERKSTEDFVNSLINKNLFEQVANLTHTYEKPILIIEGEELYSIRQINPKAIKGALISLTIDFGLTIFNTKDADDTASFIATLAKREQNDEHKKISLHGKKSMPMLYQQQEYIISAINEIGPTTAKNLLLHFGSVEKVISASYEELIEVPNVGKKTALKIREVVSEKYKA